MSYCVIDGLVTVNFDISAGMPDTASAFMSIICSAIINSIVTSTLWHIGDGDCNIAYQLSPSRKMSSLILLYLVYLFRAPVSVKHPGL